MAFKNPLQSLFPSNGGDEIEKSQKKIKKVLTNDKTHDIISELRREIQHRTLTNKQQCNPENSK